jgi:hypothetical protein
MFEIIVTILVFFLCLLGQNLNSRLDLLERGGKRLDKWGR